MFRKTILPLGAVLLFSLLELAGQAWPPTAVRQPNNGTSAQTSPPRQGGSAVDIGRLLPSNILQELRKRKTLDPRLSSEQLARIGNGLLRTHGLSFSIDPGGYKRVSGNKYTVASFAGKDVSFEVEEPVGGPCNDVILYLPVRKINTAEIALVSGSNMYRLKRPKEFHTEEFALVDRGLRKTIRRWAAPIDATPYGISADGRKLYFEFDFSDPVYQNSLQFEDLIYEVSADGTIRFVPKNHPAIVKGKVLKFQSKGGEFAYMSFNAGKRKYFVRYSTICT